VDAGVAEGGDVPVHYDPMLAKVIAYGERRDVAIARLVAALRDYPILGVRTNIAFLIAVLEHPRFLAGDVATAFLDREGSSLATVPDELPQFLLEALGQIIINVGSGPEARSPEPEADPWSTLRGWRP
jgi:3-methylcrotonyl-CoA carboxylase alpha subunit